MLPGFERKARLVADRPGGEATPLADTTSMALLHGTDLNIAGDGTVDWDEDFLSGFDICVASVQTESPNPAIAMRCPSGF